MRDTLQPDVLGLEAERRHKQDAIEGILPTETSA
jgi:hypothetical protein